MPGALIKTLSKGLRNETSALSLYAPAHDPQPEHHRLAPLRRAGLADRAAPRDRQGHRHDHQRRGAGDVQRRACAPTSLELDALPDTTLVAMVPVGLNAKQSQVASAEGGNAVGAVMVQLGTDLADPADRLRAIHRSMQDGKEALSSMTPTQILAMSALGQAPAILTPMLRMQGIMRPPYNLIISNVPGPRTTHYWNGARLIGTYPLSIPINGMALNITCTSYDGKMCFGLTGCRRTVPHLQRLLTHLDDELDGAGEGRRGLESAHSSPPPTASATAAQPGPGDVGDGRAARPAAAFDPGRVGSAELMLRQRRVPPSAALASATACPVVPLPAKESSTTTSPGMVARIRRTSPVGLGDSKTWPMSSLSSATAVSVEPISSESQIVRSFLRRPPVAVQPVPLEDVDPLAVAALDLAADQVVGTLVDPRPATSATRPGARRRRPARSPARPSNVAPSRPARSPGRPTPGSAGCGAVTGLNFLLVLRSGRWRKRAAVVAVQREVVLVDGLGAAGVEHAALGVARVGEEVLVAGREPAARAGGPWG